MGRGGGEWVQDVVVQRFKIVDGLLSDYATRFRLRKS